MFWGYRSVFWKYRQRILRVHAECFRRIHNPSEGYRQHIRSVPETFMETSSAYLESTRRVLGGYALCVLKVPFKIFKYSQCVWRGNAVSGRKGRGRPLQRVHRIFPAYFQVPGSKGRGVRCTEYVSMDSRGESWCNPRQSSSLVSNKRHARLQVRL